MDFHPYAEIFPLIEDSTFDELAADIKAHGLREPIWLYEGKILDGRNRFMACATAQVEPKYREFTGSDSAARALVISANVHRRHLTESQRAMAAAKLACISHGGERKKRDQDANLHLDRAAAAGALKVSKRSVASASKVISQGSKALQQAVETGQVSVSKAAAVVDRPKPQQLKAAQEKSQPKPIEVTPAPDFDFTDYEPENDEAYKQSVENVMMADDKLAAMRGELEQAHREIQALKCSRDHYQSQAGEAVRLLKARDREIEKLKRELAKAKGEFVGLGAERLNS